MCSFDFTTLEFTVITSSLIVNIQFVITMEKSSICSAKYFIFFQHWMCPTNSVCVCVYQSLISDSSVPQSSIVSINYYNHISKAHVALADMFFTITINTHCIILWLVYTTLFCSSKCGNISCLFAKIHSVQLVLETMLILVFSWDLFTIGKYITPPAFH